MSTSTGREGRGTRAEHSEREGQRVAEREGGDEHEDIAGGRRGTEGSGRQQLARGRGLLAVGTASV